MKIKRNDTVKILSGKDKGKTGKVLKVLVASNLKGKSRLARVVVEGLNLRYKHVKARRQGEKGQRIMFPAPLSMAKVALICPKCGKPTRVGYKLLERRLETVREKKQRICKKCNSVI